MTSGHVADSIVELDDVSVRYGNNVVLENVSMKVEKGTWSASSAPTGAARRHC
jgi:ABC-type transporter Mla maintaining outer membrane lipid asymmetry ATPase subunit MlaF